MPEGPLGGTGTREDVIEGVDVLQGPTQAGAAPGTAAQKQAIARADPTVLGWQEFARLALD
jgi:hypothetical protein